MRDRDSVPAHSRRLQRERHALFSRTYGGSLCTGELLSPVPQFRSVQQPQTRLHTSGQEPPRVSHGPFIRPQVTGGEAMTTSESAAGFCPAARFALKTDRVTAATLMVIKPFKRHRWLSVSKKKTNRLTRLRFIYVREALTYSETFHILCDGPNLV